MSEKDFRERSKIAPVMEESLLALAGIPKRYRSADLADYPEFSLAFKQETSYYIQGPVGSGKTHMLAAMAKERVLSRWGQRKVLFTTAYKMLDNIKAGFQKPDLRSLDDEEESRIDSWVTRYEEVPILAIDDFGMDQVTDWRLGTMFSIINHRYNEMMVTYLSSNMSLAVLAEKFDERIASRIYQMCNIIELKKKDWRVEP